MDEQNFPNIFEEQGNTNFNELPPVNKIERLKSDKIIAGVCSGVARYFNMDPSILRLLALFSLLFGMWSVAAYFIAAFLIPQEMTPQELTVDEIELINKTNSRTFFGGLLMLSGLYAGLIYWNVYSFDNIFSLPQNFMFPFIAIVIGSFFLSLKEDLFHKSKQKFPNNFSRTKTDRLFLGVCGGLADYLNVQTIIVRTVFLISTILTLGLFGIVYFLIVLVIPLEGKDLESQP